MLLRYALAIYTLHQVNKKKLRIDRILRGRIKKEGTVAEKQVIGLHRSKGSISFVFFFFSCPTNKAVSLNKPQHIFEILRLRKYAQYVSLSLASLIRLPQGALCIGALLMFPPLLLNHYLTSQYLILDYWRNYRSGIQQLPSPLPPLSKYASFLA